MKTPEDKQTFLDALRENHIVLAVCRKLNIGKTTYYRWRDEDLAFAAAADDAIRQGLQLVNDAAESNVVTGVKNRDKDMTKFWLTHRHPGFAPKLKVENVLPDEQLTPEEEEQMMGGLLKMHNKLKTAAENPGSIITSTNTQNSDVTPEPSAGDAGDPQGQAPAPSGDTA